MPRFDLQLSNTSCQWLRRCGEHPSLGALALVSTEVLQDNILPCLLSIDESGYYGLAQASSACRQASIESARRLSNGRMFNDRGFAPGFLLPSPRVESSSCLFQRAQKFVNNLVPPDYEQKGLACLQALLCEASDWKESKECYPEFWRASHYIPRGYLLWPDSCRLGLLMMVIEDMGDEISEVDDLYARLIGPDIQWEMPDLINCPLVRPLLSRVLTDVGLRQIAGGLASAEFLFEQVCLLGCPTRLLEEQALSLARVHPRVEVDLFLTRNEHLIEDPLRLYLRLAKWYHGQDGAGRDVDARSFAKRAAAQVASQSNDAGDDNSEDEARDMRPDQLEALVLCGSCLVMLATAEALQEAVDLYDAALRIDSSHAGAILGKAQAIEHIGAVTLDTVA